MIELTNVTRVYPMGVTEVRALNGVSLRIEQGEFVAIVGSSGSGKSTMMHVLGCLDRPTSGEYRLLDQPVSALSDRQLARVRNQKIGFVFQTFNLVSRASAWENVALPLFYARQARTHANALEALERVHLAPRAGHAPNELSGGERQRVAIARAIVNDPALILADEPTGNLDTRTGNQIMAIFHRLHQGGVTIVLVTHEPDIAKQADRVVTMRDGLIIDDRPNRDKQYPPGWGPHGATEGAPAAATAWPVEDADALTPALARAGDARGQVGGGLAAAVPGAGERPAGTGGGLAVHPQARKAITWAIAGWACLLAMFAAQIGAALLQRANATTGVIMAIAIAILVLFLATLVAPVLGVIQGRRAARWIRLAPERFSGLGRAKAAIWVSLAQLLLVLGLVALTVASIVVNVRNQVQAS